MQFLAIVWSVLLLATVSGLQQPAAQRPAATHEHKLEVLRVMVPAYFYPVPGSPWERLNQAAAAHPGRVFAIGNPGSGPGLVLDPLYVSTFTSFRQSGGKLLGYVYTSYGARPLSEVKADIDQWFAWYPLDGIFLDEMDNTPGAHESYYQALHAHVQALASGALVVGNPGVNTVPSYLHWNSQPVVSSACIYEAGDASQTWIAAPWALSYPRKYFYALPYNTAASGWKGAVDHAFANHCGWVYVTDDVLPNPWDTLPAYFETMLGYIAATY